MLPEYATDKLRSAIKFRALRRAEASWPSVGLVAGEASSGPAAHYRFTD